MYFKRFNGCILKLDDRPTEKGALDIFIPETCQSRKWRHWVAQLDSKLCPVCLERHGKVYKNDEEVDIEPPLHVNCRCAILPVEAIKPGFATEEQENGADYWLAYKGILPDYYISKEELYKLGWKNGKPIKKFAPGKMLSGGIYQNDDGHLPDVPGRIWFEADLNYYEGRRNGHRILFSNDGLIFVTYNHYRTFYEIIKEV